MPQARKLIDVPLADFAPPEIRERLVSDDFAHLLGDSKDCETRWRTLSARKGAGAAEVLRAYDSYAAAMHRVEAYKDVTASLLPGCAVPEADFLLPEGVASLGEAGPGTLQWARMRHGTVGGSDVGAICKVGRYGKWNYEQVRASKLAPASGDKNQGGAALRGDLWEPWLVSMVGPLLDVRPQANKGTYTDGARHVNIDGFIAAKDGRVARVIEAKTSSHPDEWEDTVPDGHVLQVQHYSDFLDAQESALVVANLNDERLVVWEVPLDHAVSAGPDSPHMLGTKFTYRDVRAYVEGMVKKWAMGDPRPSVKVRRSFQDSEEIRQTWHAAMAQGMVLGDIETTGYSPERGHIIEVALVRVSGGVEVGRFHRFYGVPADHAKWNGTGPEHVHKISLSDVAGLPVLIDSPEEVRAIQEFIGDSVLVAHNAPFERKWLSNLGVSVPYADTRLAFGLAVLDVCVEGNSMADLMQWAGLEYRDAHRAINDVLMMLAALPALLEAVVEWLATKPGKTRNSYCFQ